MRSEEQAAYKAEKVVYEKSLCNISVLISVVVGHNCQRY